MQPVLPEQKEAVELVNGAWPPFTGLMLLSDRFSDPRSTQVTSLSLLQGGDSSYLS